MTSISIEAMPEGTSLYAAMGTYSATFEWAALYEGEYTAETLPEYKPKGYGAELAECQRYYMQFGRIMAPGFLTNGGKCYSMIINTPVAMRVSPSVLAGVKWYARLPGGGYSKHTGSDYTSFTSVSIENYEGNGVVIADNVATAVDTNNIILVYTIQNLCLSADL